MSLDIWRRILIDRISMNISIDNNDLYGFAWGQTIEVHYLRKELFPSWQIVLKKDSKMVRISFYPEENRKIADIEVGRQYNHRYIKLGLYPSIFRGMEFSRVKELLKLLFDPLDYERFFLGSHISYIELAIDSLTRPAHSFIPFRAKTNHSSIFIDKLGAKGTTYLGSMRSGVRFAIYDKAKQLKETGKFVQQKLHTRFEYRGTNIKAAPIELSTKLLNPFEKLMIADLSLAETAWNDKSWLAFLDHCLNDGSASALASLTKSERKVYMHRLRDSRAAWWAPQAHWKWLNEALTRIAP
jgi:hypothetical protein